MHVIYLVQIMIRSEVCLSLSKLNQYTGTLIFMFILRLSWNQNQVFKLDVTSSPCRLALRYIDRSSAPNADLS